MNKELFARIFKLSADTGSGGSETSETPDNVKSGTETETQSEPETFKGPQSQSELDSLTNKAVQKALENYKKGEQQRIAEAIQKEKDYANLSAAEREKRDFEDQQAQLAQERAVFEHEKLVVQVTKDLAEKGLPVDFAELLAVGTPEEALAQVGKFETAFNEAVNAKVKESLRQNPPQNGGSGVSSSTNYGARLGASVAQASGKLVD